MASSETKHSLSRAEGGSISIFMAACGDGHFLGERQSITSSTRAERLVSNFSRVRSRSGPILRILDQHTQNLVGPSGMVA